jgi:hypothetical protein
MAGKEKSVTGRAFIPSFDYGNIHLINGGWPIPDFRIPIKVLDEILKDCPRIAIEGAGAVAKKSAETAIYLRKIIAGGIRMPHLHLKDEIILMDKPALQKYLQAAAEEVENIADITDIGDFIRR